MSSQITPKVCISSISKKLYIIKTKSCISSLRKLFMHTKRCDEIQGRLAALDDIHRTSYGDDMPLLSQWIKKGAVSKRIFRAYFLICRSASIADVGAAIGRPRSTMLRIRRKLMRIRNIFMPGEQCSPLRSLSADCPTNQNLNAKRVLSHAF